MMTKKRWTGECPRCKDPMEMRSLEDCGDWTYWLVCSNHECYLTYGMCCDGHIDGTDMGVFESEKELIDSWCYHH